MPERTVIVIGGGPAGLMAAGQAALAGASVTVLEKMPQPARKLRITGKGRCNLTNIAPLPEFIGHFGPRGVFLRSCFARFFSEDLVAFFEALGVPLVTERGGRVFPESERAAEIADALLRWARGSGVALRPRAPVAAILVRDGRVRGVRAEAGEIAADAIVLATGGASYPATGSTGDGYALARAVGHTIVPPRPALVPLVTAGNVATRLQGLSLRNVTARVIVDGRRRPEAFGEMLFTHFGLSGPIILTLSRTAVDALRERRGVEIAIDLKPALDAAKLDERLRREIREHGRRSYRTLLGELLPRTLIPVAIDLTEIDPEKPGSQLGAKERMRLRDWLKDFRLTVTGHRSWEEAVITAGGIDTRAVDPRTMESRIVAGLHFAGEVLDIDADTGGYNLQAAFSTGWMAGRAAAGGRALRKDRP